MDLVAREKFDSPGRELARGELGGCLLQAEAESEGISLCEAVGNRQFRLRLIASR
jgi:hypothetical protein